MKSNFCKIPASKLAHDDKMTRMAGWRCEMRRMGRVDFRCRILDFEFWMLDFPVFVSAPDGAACLRRLSRRSCSAAETDGLREFWMLDFSIFVSAPDGAACLRRLSRRSCSAAETDGLRECVKFRGHTPAKFRARQCGRK